MPAWQGCRFAQRLLRQPRFVDQVRAALEVAPAGVGEFDPARRAVEQAHAELALHCGNAARQGGTGHAEVGAGAAEVARARDLYEQGHVM